MSGPPARETADNRVTEPVGILYSFSAVRAGGESWFFVYIVDNERSLDRDLGSGTGFAAVF
jgi:hypothetical protein